MSQISVLLDNALTINFRSTIISSSIVSVLNWHATYLSSGFIWLNLIINKIGKFQAFLIASIWKYYKIRLSKIKELSIKELDLKSIFDVMNNNISLFKPFARNLFSITKLIGFIKRLVIKQMKSKCNPCEYLVISHRYT